MRSNGTAPGGGESDVFITFETPESAAPGTIGGVYVENADITPTFVLVLTARPDILVYLSAAGRLADIARQRWLAGDHDGWLPSQRSACAFFFPMVLEDVPPVPDTVPAEWTDQA